MSLNAIISSAMSGMNTAQLGLNTVSDNVANLNTAGYSAKVVDQNSLVLSQLGMGVSTSGIELAANLFLQNANLSASAAAASSGAVSNLIDQAQDLFGDPSSSSSYFSELNQVFTDVSTASNSPTSTVDRSQVVSDLNQFLTQSQNISSSLEQLGVQADTQIGSDVTEANQLLSQIASLNTQISTATTTGADPTDSQNAQNELINQLSGLMDVQVQTTSTGGVLLKTQSGQTLVGQGGAATLSYTPSATASTAIQISPPGEGESSQTALQLASGEMQGLLNMRNTVLPGVEDQLSEFVTQSVNALNTAHNASSAMPPPQTLTGQNVGQNLAASVTGFTGATNVAIVNSSGQLQETVTIDFSAGTMSVNGGTATSFTPSTFLSSLNTALGSYGSASFNNGVLSISASSSSNGVAIADDSSDPSDKVGEGFSQYFGLNNLVTSSQVTNYNTGLTASDPSDFPAGQTLTLAVSNSSGAPFTDVTITTPGGTVQDLLNSLNSASTGVGLYGQFSLDSNGALTFTPSTPGGASISVIKDQTSNSVGTSVSQLFGIGSQVTGDRTNGYSVRSDIQANPSNLAFATLDLSNATSGEPVLAAGDNSGALALANAGSTTMNFAAAGTLGAMSTTINQYAAEFAGGLSNQSSAADEASTNAQSAQTAASSRLSSVTGVNLDEELVNMTTYQQAFSASARVVTAQTDLFNALMSMMGT